MKESQVSDRPTMRWLPVVDENGRTRMEAVWVAGDAVARETHAA
ncbi:hypothetical protein [Nocardioides sp. SYSU D00038]|nr:hypothetical protein [Nocardioides sp. SYSU D00038]